MIFSVYFRYILEARELPILTMIDRINQQLMTRVCAKQEEGEKFPGPICPKPTCKLNKFVDLAAECYVLPAGEGVFDVRFRDKQYIVELLNKSCTCRRWDISGIPCHHAISCMRHERITPTDLVHPAYSVERFRSAYAHNIMPCRDRSEWAVVNNCPKVAPPHYEKKVGRPKKSRRKQPEEKQSKNGGIVMSKHGVIIHCSHCGNPGHNKSGCSWFKAGMPPKKQRRKKSRAMPDSDDDDVPIITQENLVPAGDYTFPMNSENPTVESVENTMLEEMVHQVIANSIMSIYSIVELLTFIKFCTLLTHFSQVPPRSNRNVYPSPLPDSTFIIAELSQDVASGTSSGVEHNIAAKAEAMKQAKLREHQEKKEASIAAKLKKTQEAKQLKDDHKQYKKMMAQQKREEAAELRKIIAAEKKEALLAARQEQAAQKQAEKAQKAAARKEKALPRQQ
jgi:hypothetical protein